MTQANEQYFSAHPTTKDVRSTLDVTIRGRNYTVEVSNSVFSNSRLDLGTKVLLDRVPAPEGTNLLDIGCGWGPITLGLAADAPQDATVWAVDVNERAVELTTKNAQAAGFTHVSAGTSESLADAWKDVTFDTIWSNPPIRIGKEALHALLLEYLPRLTPGTGRAYLVVQKHLGADPLIAWLNDQLGDQGLSATKYASAKGYRIIEVTRH
ncbi:hypothetical protein B9G54_06530 [Alloscardovia macacae]|uniref:Methyltransferase small domain-containing protein n=1 Tax=Alloscardovia macacae TaxID=1160091 RepID=A0A1Y2SV03_9BIFI|nr:methyltransferase [Alloscardovia macacae]OTA25915.1 hypothetical protein B9G54_06530 [Alloscardovia macacae]OTA28266.1 hypothetical protein B9T39_07035 [Alloscardovia macacae]